MIFRKELIPTILKMSVPVVLGMMARTLMNVVDTAMVGQLGPAAVAASGLAGLIVWIIISTFLAISTGIQTTVSRRYGKGNFEACGQVINTILPIAFLAGSILAFTGYYPNVRDCFVAKTGVC